MLSSLLLFLSSYYVIFCICKRYSYTTYRAKLTVTKGRKEKGIEATFTGANAQDVEVLQDVHSESLMHAFTEL